MSAPRNTPTRSDSERAFHSEGASTAPSEASPGKEGAPAEPALERRDVALARSALWEALALGFRAPTEETVRRLATCESAGALVEAAAMLDGVPGGDLARRTLALAGEPPAAPAALAEDHGRIFGHTARGQVAPYETEYGEDSLFAPAREMSDLGAFLRAFGLVVRPGAGERPDHIACECEFLLVLARKEAHALEAGDGAMLEATRQATRAFLRDHLGRWAPAFGARLARQDRGGFYGALGDLCAAFVAWECGRAGVPAGPDFLRLRSPDPGAAPMACGEP